MVVTMGKGKKRKAPAPLAAQERHKEEAPNLFERLSNKKRFSILGRKVKGETRQLGKLRTAAGERVSGVGAAAAGGTQRPRVAHCLCLPARASHADAVLPSDMCL